MPFYITGTSRENSLCIYPHQHTKIPFLVSFESENDSEFQGEEYDVYSENDRFSESLQENVIPLKIIAGKYHGFILTADEDVYAFGNNPVALGINPESIEDPIAWKKRSSLFNMKLHVRDFFNNIRVKDIACGEDFTFVLTQSDELYCFGANSHGNLGLGHTVDVHIPTKNSHPAFISEPYDQFQGSRSITHISCGNYHTCIVLDSVDVFCFGSNKEFQCGISNGVTDTFQNGYNITEPRHILSFLSSDNDETGGSQDEVKEHILHIASGREHNVVVTESQDIWTWGGNQFGECGLGHKKPVVSPQRINFPLESPIKLLSCGEYFTVFITESNDIFVSGKFRNQIYLVPTQLQFNSERYEIDQLSVGDTFFMFTSNSNTILWVCGDNDAFQLGNEFQGGVDHPVMIDQDFLNGSAFSHVACGNHFAMFSTFIKKYDLQCYDDLKDQLLVQGHRRTGYLYDLELAVSGKPFCVSRDLIEKRFPLALQLDRTNDVISSEAFSLCIDYIYSDEIHVPRDLENPELVLLELYTFIVSNKNNKKNIVSSKLEFSLLERLIEVINETTVVFMLRKLDDFMKIMNGYSNGHGVSHPDSLNDKSALTGLQDLRKHMLAYLKQVMDQNRLKDVPNFKALPVEILHEILLQGSEYRIISVDDFQESHSTYIEDLRTLCLDMRCGNTKLMLDASGQYSLRVHRSIIAARCPKLKDVLNDHFKKNNDILVFVDKLLEDDSMIQTFPEFIEYLYTGEITISPKNAQSMIRLWEVMGMPLNHIVFIRCQEMAVNTLNLDNVLPLYKSLLSRKGTNTNQSLGILEEECKKLCLRYWRDLHARHGEKLLHYFQPRMYFWLNFEYMGIRMS